MSVYGSGFYGAGLYGGGGEEAEPTTRPSTLKFGKEYFPDKPHEPTPPPRDQPEPHVPRVPEPSLVELDDEDLLVLLR